MVKHTKPIKKQKRQLKEKRTEDESDGEHSSEGEEDNAVTVKPPTKESEIANNSSDAEGSSSDGDTVKHTKPIKKQKRKLKKKSHKKPVPSADDEDSESGDENEDKDKYGKLDKEQKQKVRSDRRKDRKKPTAFQLRQQIKTSATSSDLKSSSFMLRPTMRGICYIQSSDSDRFSDQGSDSDYRPVMHENRLNRMLEKVQDPDAYFHVPKRKDEVTTREVPVRDARRHKVHRFKVASWQPIARSIVKRKPATEKKRIAIKPKPKSLKRKMHRRTFNQIVWSDSDSAAENSEYDTEDEYILSIAKKLKVGKSGRGKQKKKGEKRQRADEPWNIISNKKLKNKVLSNKKTCQVRIKRVT